MTTEMIVNGTKNYLKVELQQFNQKDEAFYIAKIKASDFLKIYTVRPAQYDLEKHTALANSFPDEKDYYTHLITEDKLNIKEKDFQRDPNNERISSIEKFLKNEDYAFFPNTIISNCELINDWDDFELDENNTEDDFFAIADKPSFLSFLKKDNDKHVLFIPFISNSVLVIDGQHRLEGLKKSTVDIQKQYDLIIAFIIGYDRSIIAKQFYTINYEQKPVNKSLLYQLTGEFTREINEISFMHNTVKLLNEVSSSPFYGRVKMLGKTPKGLEDNAKRKLSISQSFLIDSTIRFISASAKGTLYPPIFLKYFRNKDQHILIVRTIARYFNAVKIIKPEWEHPDQSIISKGMGVSALLKVLNLLFPIIFDVEMKRDWTKIEALQIEDYQRILKGLEDVDFSTDGPYGKIGSAGNIAKIKNEIITKLLYTDYSEPTLFENNLKRAYLPIFNQALHNV